MCPAIYKSYMGTDLHSCDEENDIGVLIDGELSFDKHITGSTKVNKANVMFKWGYSQKLSVFGPQNFYPAIQGFDRDILIWIMQVLCTYHTK